MGSIYPAIVSLFAVALIAVNPTASYSGQTSRSLSGSVRLNEGLLPDQRVRLSLYGATGALVSELFADSTGNFEFNGLRAGIYRLHAQAAGYQPTSVDIEILSYNIRTSLPPIILNRVVAEKGEKASAGTVAAGEFQIPKAAQEALEKGQLAAEQHRQDEARNHFARALKLYPQFFKAQYWLGVTLTLLGDLPAARKAEERAIELNPRVPEPYLALGKVLNLMNEAREAKTVMLKGTGVDPSVPGLWVELSRAEFALSEFSAAVEHAVQALELSQEAPVEVHLILANAYIKLKRYPDAERELTVFLNRDPESPSAPKARQVLDQLHRAGIRSP